MFDRMVEIGYGSGIFLPELARRCKELHGVDVHEHGGEVAQILAKRNVKAMLHQADAGTEIPLESGFADCVVAVSSLEFIPNLGRACREVRRILKPGGMFIVVTPGVSPVLDFGLWMLTGKNAKEDFEDRRDSVVPALLRSLAQAARMSA